MDPPSFTIPYKVPKSYGQDEETHRHYSERGFPEVLVGDVYSHYKVVRKLGYGAYSTVWLAVDLRSDIAVALKVLALGASRSELEIMQQMADVDATRSEPGFGENVIKLLDSFEQPGVNGSHLCLVMELMWQDIGGFIDSYRSCEAAEVIVPLTQTIAKQALQGLEFMKQCGVVHNDLHLNNLLVKFGRANMTLDEVLRKDKNHACEPGHFAIYTLDNGRKVKYYKSLPLYGFEDGEQIRLEDMVIKISDFGHACFEDDPPEKRPDLGARQTFTAPEALIGKHWDCAANLWSLGVAIFEILTGEQLFAYSHRHSHNTFLLLQIARVSGPLPEYMEDLTSPRIRDEQEYGPNDYSCGLQARLTTCEPQFSGRWINLICDFLYLMLEIEPTQRASIQEVLSHRFWKPYQSAYAYPCKCGHESLGGKLTRLSIL